MPVPRSLCCKNTSEVAGEKSQEQKEVVAYLFWVCPSLAMELPFDGSLFRVRFYFSMFSIWFLCVRNSACHGHILIFLLLKLNIRGGDSLGEESVCVH